MLLSLRLKRKCTSKNLLRCYKNATTEQIKGTGCSSLLRNNGWRDENRKVSCSHACCYARSRRLDRNLDLFLPCVRHTPFLLPIRTNSRLPVPAACSAALAPPFFSLDTAQMDRMLVKRKQKDSLLALHFGFPIKSEHAVPTVSDRRSALR